MGVERSIPGRKVLFIDPPSVIEDQMIQFLINAQYEAAVVKDIRHIPILIRQHPNAVIYFNLDSRTGKEDKEQVITDLLKRKEEHNLIIGVLSYDKNEETAKKYLMELGANGGYITLDLGFKKSAQILLRVLDAAEAKGERQFVRVKVPRGKGSLNIDTGSEKHEGELIDISVVGMACTVTTTLTKGSRLDSIQLRLWGKLVPISGTVAGSRETANGLVWVIMFDLNLPPETRTKIYTFLGKVMQHEVDVLT